MITGVNRLLSGSVSLFKCEACVTNKVNRASGLVGGLNVRCQRMIDNICPWDYVERLCNMCWTFRML